MKHYELLKEHVAALCLLLDGCTFNEYLYLKDTQDCSKNDSSYTEATETEHIITMKHSCDGESDGITFDLSY